MIYQLPSDTSKNVGSKELRRKPSRKMRSITFLLVLVIHLVPAAWAGVREDIDALVAQLPKFAETSPEDRMDIPEGGPVKELLTLGIEAVPFLVPHLSNLAMTQSFRVRGRGRKEQISVNEFVGHVITRSCGHFFYIASGDRVLEHLGEKPIKNPETIGLYQEQVNKWYDYFGLWKESERKLVDVDDWFHYNRFNAYEFFAKNPLPKGRQRLRARIQILLTKPQYDSMIARELVSCSEAIASMGNVSDLDLVKQAWTNEFEQPLNTSGREDNVKRLYQSRVKLEDQQQAKADIDAYNLKYSGRFPPIKIK